MRKIWKAKTEVTLVVISALVRVSKELERHLNKIGVRLSVEPIQKIALRGIAKILQKRKRREVSLAKS